MPPSPAGEGSPAGRVGGIAKFVLFCAPKYLVLTIMYFYVKIINNTFYDIFCSWGRELLPTRVFCGGGKMKADFDIHQGTILLLPCRTDVWRDGAKPIARAVIGLAALIAQYEPVYLGVPGERASDPMLSSAGGAIITPMEYDDIWVRDSGAVPVGDRLVRFGFNAWGGEDGLYGDWSRDSSLPEQMSKLLSKPLENCPLTLEGGNLATDGEGTLIAIKDSIVCDNRNPGIDEKEAERLLKNALGVHRILWIDKGIAYDETGGHIDNLCAFADAKTVMLAWTDDPGNPSYNAVRAAEGKLTEGGYEIVKIPLPAAFARSEEDCRGICLKAGSKPRLPGEIIQPSYINFIFAGEAVIVPTFEDERDGEALEIFARQFPNRPVIPFPAREVVLGGGGLHCITKNF